MESWADDRTLYELEIMKSRLRTLIDAILTIVLLAMTIKSMKPKNERLFYWTYLIGFTIFQIISFAGLLSN